MAIAARPAIEGLDRANPGIPTKGEQTIRLELCTEDVDLLRGIVDQRIVTLGQEIHHTQSRAFRHALEGMQEKLQALSDRFHSVAAAPSN